MATNDFEWADTTAASMLAGGLKRAGEERGLSIRQLGRNLGYKQAVVLSHMASGRTPIPIDRAEDIAVAVGLDRSAFLSAVVEQRHPTVNWGLIAGGVSSGQDALAMELEEILGAGLGAVSSQQRKVMREVVAEPHPERRWLTVHELAAVGVIRRCRPSVAESGLSPDDLAKLRDALA